MKIKPEGSDKPQDGGKYGTLLASTEGVPKPVIGSGQGGREGFSAVTTSQSGKGEPGSLLGRQGTCMGPVARRLGEHRGRRISQEKG